MNRSTHWPGQEERNLAALLVERLPAEIARLTEWHGIQLRRNAEHVLYVALTRSRAGEAGTSVVRALARTGRAVLQSRPDRGQRRAEGRRRVVALITQPVHGELYRPVAQELTNCHVDSVVVDAETRAGKRVHHSSVDSRLVEYLRATDAPSLGFHAVRVAAALRIIPHGWRDLVENEVATRLLTVLSRGLSLAALDAARVDAITERLCPDAIVCFSESGMLARVVPAAARRRGIPVVDLPHAEANDPHGSAGVDYDLMMVYGPRSRLALEVGGILRERIIEIGPLRYDRLVAEAATTPATDPRRVVFASQPADPDRPSLHPDVKAAALATAVAAAASLSPAELVVVPHPTEPAGEAEGFVAGMAIPDGVQVRLERKHDLHAMLPGSWLLVTASSQSVYDAVVSGVPAMTVSPPGRPTQVTFAEAGIAIGVGSEHEGAQIAKRLLADTTRRDIAAQQQAALGGRIGPIDGRAAKRAAEVLLTVINERTASRQHGLTHG